MMERNNTLSDEPGRLAALRRLNVLDSPPEQPFDDVVNLVRAVLGVPMAAVSLIDADRQWLKARAGITASETPRDISFCTHTIRERMPLVISDALIDARTANSPLVLGDPNIRSYAGIPLATPDGYQIGALCAIDVKPRNYSESELAILANLARIVMNELELRQIAQRDQLTGALSRRGFIAQAEAEISRFRRRGRASSLVMVDIDHFKSVNDTYGHPAGDRVLRELAGLMTMVKRPTDHLGRLGGEEFAILLAETDGQDALSVCERLRHTIASTPIELGAGQFLNVSASFGIALLEVQHSTAEDWIAAADGPLYEAKRAGRNRCVLRGVSPAWSEPSALTSH